LDTENFRRVSKCFNIGACFGVIANIQLFKSMKT